MHPVERIEVRPVGIDEWSHVRHVHLSSFARLTGNFVEQDAIAAFRQLVATTDYTAELQREELQAAWIDGQLVGTCGWLPAYDNGISARITSLFVLPVFARSGVGRRLLDVIEACARAGGYQVFTTRATGNAVPFFEAMGYAASSQGVSAIAGNITVPVTFMRKRDGKLVDADGISSGIEPDRRKAHRRPLVTPREG